MIDRPRTRLPAGLCNARVETRASILGRNPGRIVWAVVTTLPRHGWDYVVAEATTLDEAEAVAVEWALS
jgi:hypothetical protein